MILWHDWWARLAGVVNCHDSQHALRAISAAAMLSHVIHGPRRPGERSSQQCVTWLIGVPRWERRFVGVVLLQLSVHMQPRLSRAASGHAGRSHLSALRRRRAGARPQPCKPALAYPFSCAPLQPRSCVRLSAAARVQTHRYSLVPSFALLRSCSYALLSFRVLHGSVISFLRAVPPSRFAVALLFRGMNAERGEVASFRDSAACSRVHILGWLSGVLNASRPCRQVSDASGRS